MLQIIKSPCIKCFQTTLHHLWRNCMQAQHWEVGIAYHKDPLDGLLFASPYTKASLLKNSCGYSQEWLECCPIPAHLTNKISKYLPLDIEISRQMKIKFVFTCVCPWGTQPQFLFSFVVGRHSALQFSIEGKRKVPRKATCATKTDARNPLKQAYYHQKAPCWQ